MSALEFAAAEKKHAADLAALCDIASHGRNAGLWQRAVDEGQSTSVFEIGRQGALIPGHDLSLEHASVALRDGEVIGAVFGMARPKDYGETLDLDAVGPELRTEMELKAQTGGTWYLAVLAVYRENQRFGYGAALVKEAAKRARAAKQRKMTLIVAASNEPAKKLYLKAGFRIIDERPIGDGSDDKWLLMRRILSP